MLWIGGRGKRKGFHAEARRRGGGEWRGGKVEVGFGVEDL